MLIKSFSKTHTDLGRDLNWMEVAIHRHICLGELQMTGLSPSDRVHQESDRPVYVLKVRKLRG